MVAALRRGWGETLPLPGARQWLSTVDTLSQLRSVPYAVQIRVWSIRAGEFLRHRLIFVSWILHLVRSGVARA